MSKEDKSARPSKREIIVINSDSDSDQPAAKRATEPVPSPEVLELRLKVAKLEQDFQGACRHARQVELKLEECKERVRFLENLVDKKPIVLEKPVDVEELQKTLHESSAKLEEAARKVENAARKEFETAMENAVLKSEIEGLRRTIESVKKEHNEKLRQAEENRAKDRKIIEELRGQLGELRRTLDGYHLINSEQIRTDGKSLEQTNVAAELDDSTNILVLCKSDDRATTISFDSAVAQLSAKYNYTNDEWRERFLNAVKKERSTCAVCSKKELTTTQILNHFLSKKHGIEVRAAGAAVSLAAFDYWMRKLDSIPKPIAALPATTLADGKIGGNDELTKQDEMIRDVRTDDSTNLLVLSLGARAATISFDSAVAQLSAKFNFGNNDWRKKYIDTVRKERSTCAVCPQKEFCTTQILGHFFSEKHGKKVRAAGAAVSLAAFDYWMHKLGSIPKPNPVLSVAAPPVTALADGNNGGNDEVTKQDKTILDVGIDGSTNLFMMFSPRDPATISFNSAIKQLRSKYNYKNEEWRGRYINAVKKERLECAACITVDICGGAILQHFFSKKHVTKVQGFGASVAIAAFEYWKGKLESIANPIENDCEAILATELVEGEIVD